MRLFGFQITRSKQVPSSLSTPSSRGGWWPIIREPWSGAWQRNQEQAAENVMAHSAVYACVRQISSDIAKLRIKLVEKDSEGIWNEIDSPAYSPVLRRPNHFQTRISFIRQWMINKLIHGNTYVLKQRDNRRVVVAMYVLDSTRVSPLVADNGDVYYSLQRDSLSGVREDVVVPASEIIHDAAPTFFHPLCGISPLTAAALTALQGLRAQQMSADFFGNQSVPSGILTSPATIPNDVAKDLKERWEQNYSGANRGRVAVLGSDLKFNQLTMNNVDAQLIEQLGWADRNICIAFGMPPHKIHAAPPPPYNNVQAINYQYLSDCLHDPIESIEALLDHGLGLSVDGEPQTIGTEFDIDSLLRMDTATRMAAASEAIKNGASPNEVRFRYHDLGPVKGGEAPYMQQQNFSLEALAKRDAQPDPFGTSEPAATPPASEPPDEAKALRFAKALQAEMELVSLR